MDLYIDKPNYPPTKTTSIGNIENYREFGKRLKSYLKNYWTKEDLEMAPDVFFEIAMDEMEESGLEIDPNIDLSYNWLGRDWHFKYPDPEQLINTKVVLKYLLEFKIDVEQGIENIALGEYFVRYIFLNPEAWLPLD